MASLSIIVPFLVPIFIAYCCHSAAHEVGTRPIILLHVPAVWPFGDMSTACRSTGWSSPVRFVDMLIDAILNWLEYMVNGLTYPLNYIHPFSRLRIIRTPWCQ